MIKIGHRGARGYEPENTILSFEKALELGVDWVELDVYRCKTGEIVAVHDRKLDRSTNGSGVVADKSFAEVRALDAGKGQHIPTLEEVLVCVDKRAKVNIEIKGEDAAKPVAEIIERYVQENGWQHEDFLVSSFNHYELLAFSRICPQVKVGAVIAGIPIGYAEGATKVNAYSVHPSKEFINQALVDDAHNRDMKVFVYTVNDPDDIERVKALGVDGIFSDFPDRL
ncbi:MAG: glycerophosphodiester phosphodiesterase [PVC group bacterium]|nr:glycerophosphodiester phosphodiesterase [PVC group bacterium]